MMEGLASFAFDHPQSSLKTVYISLHKKSPRCMMKWDGIFKKMVQEYNGFVSGVSNPIDYVPVTGSGGSERPNPEQSGASASQRKGRAQYTPKAPSKTPSKAPGDTSTALSGWWSLPTIFSASASVAGAQVSATPAVSGRLVNDGAEVDLSLRLKIAVPWLKTIFGRFL